MKKEYINPTIEIIKVETMQMIAESVIVEKGEGNIDPNLAGSREGRGFWDDEDEY